MTLLYDPEMEEKTNNVLTLADNLTVSAEVGNYGKYLRIMRNKKWISLGEKTWNFLKNNIPLLASSFRAGSDCGVTLTNGKSVKVSQYRGQSYVSLHEVTSVDGKPFDSYIHLNEEEWRSLIISLPKIDLLLRKEIQYTFGKGDWFFTKEATMKYKNDGALNPRDGRLRQ